MGHERRRMLNRCWHWSVACSLLACVCIGNAASALAADGDAPIAAWQYRDYLRFSSTQPLSVTDSTWLASTNINIGGLLHPQDLRDSVSRKLVFSAAFDNRAAWESIRYGLGMFADLPDAGQLHFNLYVRPHAQQPGLRWQLQPDGLPFASDAKRRLWSVGGFLDYGRDRRGLHSSIGFAPQLIVNLSPLLHLPGDAKASLQYAYWRSDAADTPDSGRALQATLTWGF